MRRPTPLSPRNLAAFQRRLLDWFRKHQRDLPWRRNKEPHRIWVAEVMLQQTRIAAVVPYYHRFLRRFPNVESLARASQEDVLRLWSGLGYYRRARNMHRAARQIVAHHGGRFPRDLGSALQLPGTGRYTAAAVLSIAYDAPVAVLDGNVARVLARIGAVRGNVHAPRHWRKLSDMAQHFLAADAPGNWNQAMMELGETVCAPQSPRCGACPISRWCQARRLGLTHRIPARQLKRASVNVKLAAAILRDPRGQTILVKYPGAHEHALFSRMWQFPAVEVSRQPKAELARHLRETMGFTPQSLEALPEARHGVTFRRITLLPFLARVRQLPKLAYARILPLSQISELPVSSATRKIAAAAVVAR
jgi:A/G-specific adenine glycosylase